MKTKNGTKARELTELEIAHVSGGGEEPGQGGGLPKPVFGKPGTIGPLPIFTDLP